MTIYIDNARIEWQGKQWCHLVADTIDELHGFAKKLGLRRSWFQHLASYPHYDVTVKVRTRAIEMGAKAASRKQIITAARKLKAELSRPKEARPIQTSLFP